MYGTAEDKTSAEEVSALDVALLTQPWGCIFGHTDADGVHNIVHNEFTVLYIKQS